MALTPYLRLTKPPFDSVPWDEAINGDMDIIDGFIAQFMSVPNFQGPWQNSTPYTTGQIALDTLTSSMWSCLVSNTSAAAPTTFAQDRTNNPSYWTNQSTPQGYLPLSGGIMNGELLLWRDPVDPLEAATKRYIDNIQTSLSATDSSLATQLNGKLSTGGGTLTGTLRVAGNGINYSARDAHYMSFSWDNTFINGWVDGASKGQMATVSWAQGQFATQSYVNSTFATTSYVNGNFYTTGTSDSRYLNKGGDTCTGGLTVNGGMATPANVSVGGAVTASTLYLTTNGTFALFGNTPTRYVQFNTGWAWAYDTASGNLSWTNNNNAAFGITIGGNGNCFNSGGVWFANSDARLKQDVEDYTPGLDALLQVRPRTYRMISEVEHEQDGGTPARYRVGVIAQEIEDIIPQSVIIEKTEAYDDLRCYESSPVLYTMINAIKELSDRILVLEELVAGSKSDDT